jgi:hypothetical protein
MDKALRWALAMAELRKRHALERDRAVEMGHDHHIPAE